MKTHVFARNITVDGIAYKHGDEVTEAEIPSGHWPNLLRLRDLIEIPKEEIERLAKRAADRMAKDVEGNKADGLENVETPKVDAIEVVKTEAIKPEEGDDPDATPAELVAKKQSNKKK